MKALAEHETLAKSIQSFHIAEMTIAQFRLSHLQLCFFDVQTTSVLPSACSKNMVMAKLNSCSNVDRSSKPMPGNACVGRIGRIIAICAVKLHKTLGRSLV